MLKNAERRRLVAMIPELLAKASQTSYTPSRPVFVRPHWRRKPRKITIKAAA